MTDHDTDRLYWLRGENRKLYTDLSFLTCVRFAWSKNWDDFWQWFWYKLSRCPVCHNKIFWEMDGEYGDYGSVIWEGLIPYHVDDEWNDECEGVC